MGGAYWKSNRSSRIGGGGGLVVSELALRAKTMRMPDATKLVIIKGYILAQYDTVAVDDGEAYVLTDEGKEIAEYLLKQDKWRKEADDFRAEFRKTEVLH